MIDVGVVIPTYNRVDRIGGALNSVLKQSLPPTEIVIIDDGSTDKTQQFIEGFVKKSSIPIKYQYTANKGVSAARNLGVKMLESQWVAFLDSDDYWLPSKLEKQCHYIEKNPNYNLVHTDEHWFRNGKFLNQKKKHRKSGGHIFEQSLKLCLISPSSVMMRKDKLEEYGGFREDILACEDYDLWLKISSKEAVGFIDEPLIHKSGGHKDQLSQKYLAQDYWRIKSMVDLIDFVSSKQKILLLTELKIKITVLIKGLSKHQRIAEADFFKDLLLTVSAEETRPPSLSRSLDRTFAQITR